ncbi:MAG: PEP-CTERM sorting domain-containing protein [Myxococcota bacterium]
MRRIVSILATAATFFAASTAGALVTISATGAPDRLVPGDVFTLEIVMTASAGSPIQGIGASVHGYGGIFRFIRGEAVGNYFNAICLGPGLCFGGLTNGAGTANGTQRTLVENSLGAFGPRVQFALSASGSPITALGGADQGLDGVLGTAMFRVTFQVLEWVPDFAFFVDTSYEGDLVDLPNGLTEEAVGVSFFYMPEPGTAVLMGLGLAGLAAATRRESRRAM